MWAFFVSGAIAICAMILPGISGAFILVMLGMYGPVLAAVTDADITALGTFAVGAVVGLAIFSQYLNWALRHHHDVVLAALVGLMGGSLRVLWPWPLGVDSTELGAPNSDVGMAIAMAIVGFVSVIALSWIANRLDPVPEPAPVVD
jgi:putative membrane protein